MQTLYPEIKPYARHALAVDEPHVLYVDESGSSDGLPVVFIHGGPGAGCDALSRRFFDPRLYRIVTFDQRGCGRSTPYASLEKNSTWDLVADMELKFIKDRQRAGIEAARAEGVYKGRKKNVDDDEIRRRLAAGASKARVARDLKVSRMTVYRALDIIPSQTKLPEKPPTASIALHLIIENFNKRGRGRKPARERIEAMLERDYAMVKNGNCDYKLTVAYDPDPDGISLDEEIQSLLSEMFNIAESYNCSMEADIYEVGGQQRSW